MTRRIIAALSLFTLAACGGGGGSAPSPAGVNVPVAPPSAAPSQTPSAQLVLRFPVAATSSSSTARKPNYVSPNAASIKVTVNSVNGAAPPSWVTVAQTTALSTAAGGNCSIASGFETCTIAIPAPPGSVSYTFSIYDASNDLLAASTTTLTIQQASNNPNLQVVLNGVVSTVTIAGPALAADTPIAAPGTALTLTAKDASGATITGSDPYVNAYTLTDSDTSGATKLSVNGGAASTSVTVGAPTDVVNIVYSGIAVPPFTIAAAAAAPGTSVTGSLTYAVPNGNLRYAPIAVTGTSPGSPANGVAPTDPNANQPTVFFAGTGQTQTIGASELGWTDTPFSQTFASATSGCGGIATVTPGALSGGAQAFSVTSASNGICSLTLTDGVGQTSTVWISVTTATINLH